MIKQDREMVQQYTSLQKSQKFLFSPGSYVPSASDKDYEYGEIIRYFLQPANQPDGEIVEVSNPTYDDWLDNSLYRALSLRWKVAGPLSDQYNEEGERIRTGVRTANQMAVRQAAKTMPAILTKLTNPLQLWRGF